MEGGEGPSFPFGHHQYKNPAECGFSYLNILPVEIPTTQIQDVDATNAGVNEDQPAPHAVVQEPIHYSPLTNLTRIMRQILPQNTRISEDSKQTLHVCVSAFIRFLTNKAKLQYQQDCCITITSDDMRWAVRNLGFNDYVEPLTTFLSYLRDVEGWLECPAYDQEIGCIILSKVYNGVSPTAAMLTSDQGLLCVTANRNTRQSCTVKTCGQTLK
ncbi:nuclear transcription factor Y subunit B-1-like isoform X1 [Senna tora]|uniref:Nuclear transcription factor Y subunit B-1-like isoform X1 n=1 Tax=Senna tora TaxID=362788 RepID=A0A834TH59_9FABA|nr:nuclear transcription factor Y subunit B-1-like isoform X1 [Senna tora]